ncbi:MAG: Gfo/Idh/MocA family oxidoreductase [Planctomycetota bacterium]|nr:Gfo/Idh/MocA family oxidoreductase [Planctomycetota bacterium]MDA1210993.1 Gfo/Idh/MocA family oxidoreductase [Planctomycetota bacterium]
MSAKIPVALITHAGGAHLGAYYAGLAASEDVESVVLADPDGNAEGPARQQLGDRLKKVYSSAGELWQNEHPKMALVSMEAKVAPPYIAQALEAGANVLAEKPACIRIDEFAEIAKLADSKHLEIMLAFANRLHPSIITAKQLLAEGALGDHYGMEMHLIADQTRLTRPEYHKQWYAHKSRGGGGHLIWLGIHWLDLAMYLENASIVKIAGFIANVGGQPIDVEDSAAVALQFENGTLGTLTSGYYLDKGYHSHIRLWGSLGWMELQLTDEMPLRWVSRQKDRPEGEQTAKATGPEGYTPFVQACVRSSAGLAEPPVTTVDSLRALKVVYGAYDAARTGTTQEL